MTNGIRITTRSLTRFQGRLWFAGHVLRGFATGFVAACFWLGIAALVAKDFLSRLTARHFNAFESAQLVETEIGTWDLNLFEQSSDVKLFDGFESLLDAQTAAASGTAPEETSTDAGATLSDRPGSRRPAPTAVRFVDCNWESLRKGIRDLDSDWMRFRDTLDQLIQHSVTLDLRALSNGAPGFMDGDLALNRQRLMAFLDSHNQFSGLPVRGENECRMDSQKATGMQSTSSFLRSAKSRAHRSIRHGFQDKLALELFQEQAWENVLWRTLSRQIAGSGEGAISTAAQMLQCDTEYNRLELVASLRSIVQPASTRALVDRLLFDVSEKVRDEALRAIWDRPSEQYQARLVEMLRYPWAPVAERAAEALAAIGDPGLRNELTPMAELPDPSLPVRKDGVWVVSELVRVNHFRNCQLCHAASYSRLDPVRAPVPSPGHPIPELYYGGSGGNVPFVRADVVYIQQDFSVMQRVVPDRYWPELQRFDYFVRTRRLTPGEVARLQPPVLQESYPQRDAILALIRKLRRRANYTAFAG